MTDRRAGFTLIEMLIVVVVIGILAAIAFPLYARYKTNAYSAVMKTDLRSLINEQEGYASVTDGSYMPAGTATASAPHFSYSPSSGVTVTIAAPTATGWAATAVHSFAPGHQCGIFVGSSPPGGANPATVSAEPACE